MTGGDDVSCCPVELMVFGREIQIAPHLPGCHATAAGYRNRAGTTSGYCRQLIDELKAGFPGRILDQNAKRLRL